MSEINSFCISLYDMGIPINMSELTFMISFWIFSLFMTRILNSKSEKFRNMTIRQKRNVITYILQLIVTTVSLLMFTFLFPRIITITSINKSFTQQDTIVASIGIGLILQLYIFELIYKIHTNWSLIIHHILTITLTSIVCFMLWDTLNPASVYPIILVYSAITEQPIFVSLLLYRFGYNSRNWFRISAITGFIFKTYVFIGGLFVLKKALIDEEFVNFRNDFPWKSFMKVVFPIGNVLLFSVQMYSIRIYLSIGEKSIEKDSPKLENKNDENILNLEVV